MAARFELDDGVGFGRGAGAFAQDNQQHSVEGTSAVVVAQAQTANVDAQGTGQFENPAAGNPPTGPVVVYTVDANTNTVKLPANVSIDDIRLEGQRPCSGAGERRTDCHPERRVERSDLYYRRRRDSTSCLACRARSGRESCGSSAPTGRSSFWPESLRAVRSSDGGDFDIPPGPIPHCPGLHRSASADRTDVPGTGETRAVSAAAQRGRSGARAPRTPTTPDPGY